LYAYYHSIPPSFRVWSSCSYRYPYSDDELLTLSSTMSASDISFSSILAQNAARDCKYIVAYIVVLPSSCPPPDRHRTDTMAPYDSSAHTLFILNNSVNQFKDTLPIRGNESEYR
jgi:hypothetical protein